MTDEIVQQFQALLGSPIVARLGFMLVVLFAGLVGLRLAQLAISRSIKDTGLRYRVRKFAGFLGYSIIAIIALSSLSKNLSQVGVIFGVAGAGIAFALQEVIASIAGWIAVSFGNFYKPGDRVELGGIKGDVIDIGMLRTTLMEVGDWVKGDLYNGRIVRVANSFVFKAPVYNYSGEFPFLWDEFTLPIRFGSDWALAHKIIEEIVVKRAEAFTQASTLQWSRMVKKFMIEEARVAPSVTLSITDNWIEFTVRYVVDYKLRRTTRDAIMRDLLVAFDRERELIQLGSATIELVGIPPIRMEAGATATPGRSA